MIEDRWAIMHISIIDGPDADEEISTGPTDLTTKFVDEGTIFIDGERLPIEEETVEE